MRTPFLIAAALLFGAAPSLSFQAVKPPPKLVGAKSAPEPLFQNVEVIGASISAGFGLTLSSAPKPAPAGKETPAVDGAPPPKTKLDLATVIEASLVGEHGALVDKADELTFMHARGSAKSAAKSLADKKPTLVVALDYLFWFGYGSNWGSDQGRLDGLEIGLKSLEGVDCPILLGDFADMSMALKSPKPMLPPDALPTSATLEKLNARVAEWAGAHKNVILVANSRLVHALNAGDEIKIGADVWPKGSDAALLQEDRLHTTLEGTVALWLNALARLREAKPELRAESFELSAAALLERIDPGAKPHTRLAVVSPAKSGGTGLSGGAGKAGGTGKKGP